MKNKFNKVVLLFLVLFVFLFTCSCGKVEGDYYQLKAPFETKSDNDLSSVPTTSAPENTDEPPKTEYNISDTDLVRVTDYIPDAIIDIKYSTNDNFTGEKVYSFDDAYLRYGTVKKLVKAADSLRKSGYKIVIWDGYRPQAAQYVLFEAKPDGNYVSDPSSGFSSHSSGGTVDITISDKDGKLLEMPSGFDEFSSKADRSYDDVSTVAAQNSALLEKAMTDAGFNGYSKEWWHYSDNQKYGFDDVKEINLPSKTKTNFLPDCEEYISLREKSDKESEVIAKIPKGTALKAIAWCQGFVGVVYGDKFGYVFSDYIK